MSPSSHRLDRINQLVREGLAEALAGHLKDPRIGFATVTNVEVNRDLSVALVRISVLGSEEERNEALVGLNSAKGFLRSFLAKRSALRTTPELKFILDRGLDHAARIEELLSDIHREPEQS